MTLCFSQKQAAAVYAATKGSRAPVYVSPFIGRLDPHRPERRRSDPQYQTYVRTRRRPRMGARSKQLVFDIEARPRLLQVQLLIRDFGADWCAAPAHALISLSSEVHFLHEIAFVASSFL